MRPTRRALLTLPLAPSARAQDRPIRLVIAFPPGGSTDLLGRLVAPRMGELLGTGVTPENRSGASGAVGAGVVAQAAPDGTTLLLDSGGQAVNPHLMRGLGFDYATAFAPVTLLATLPLVLVVRPDLGVTDLPALLARLRAEGRPAAYGSVGIGARTHLAMAALLRRAGLTGEHIPYRGGADQMAGLLRGDVAMGFTSVALAAPLLREGRLVALGYSLPGRVPAIAEQGFPGFAIGDWLALLAPAGTPPAIVQRIAAAAREAVMQPALRPRLAELGLEPAAEGPEALARFLAAERAAMGALIAAEGIRLDG
ncbi:Bug family tripartite tricarboxylate transporter substrate binding protein [Sediminicoccus rosea]|uniref:Tripartite tricarboxylate transporter substrate-binding protein n=1 Tax=Sediminicoccus rosea TaxID=1225128 RepID=A0ABZ0PCX6_9PROT|nr:tripartite tricarboxylate transporter substrate-binding protein [Sediminicoccus rosea]WPB83553.1 tripartite tricarboxylate transporter substrate-binding protein [Sediminicoccus rosea]